MVLSSQAGQHAPGNAAGGQGDSPQQGGFSGEMSVFDFTVSTREEIGSRLCHMEAQRTEMLEERGGQVSGPQFLCVSSGNKERNPFCMLWLCLTL